MSANLYPLAEANTFHIGEKFGVGTLNGNGWRVRRIMHYSQANILYCHLVVTTCYCTQHKMQSDC